MSQSICTKNKQDDMQPRDKYLVCNDNYYKINDVSNWVKNNNNNTPFLYCAFSTDVSKDSLF